MAACILGAHAYLQRVPVIIPLTLTSNSVTDLRGFVEQLVILD